MRREPASSSSCVDAQVLSALQGENSISVISSGHRCTRLRTLLVALLALQGKAWKAVLWKCHFYFLLLSQVHGEVEIYIPTATSVYNSVNCHIASKLWAVKLATIHQSPITAQRQRLAVTLGKVQGKCQNVLSWGFRIPLCCAWRGMWNSDLAVAFSVVCIFLLVLFCPSCWISSWTEDYHQWCQMGLVSWVIPGALEYCSWVMEIIYIWLTCPEMGEDTINPHPLAVLSGQTLSSCQYLRT